MAFLRTILLLAAVVLASCADETPSAPAPAPVAPSTYFGSLGPAPRTLCTDDSGLTAAERAALEWLRTTIPAARESPETRFCFVLSAATPESEGAYALPRHAAQNFPALHSGHTYVQVRCVPNGLACPEFHGVIEPAGPTLLSFWGEGG